MGKDAAVQRIAFEHGPSATADVVAFVGPVEGKRDGRLPVSLDNSIVESHFDGDEAHLAQAVTMEREPRRTE
jgi:hypothetical protein